MSRQHTHIEPSTCYTTLTPAVTGLVLKKEEETTDLRTQHFSNTPQKRFVEIIFHFGLEREKTQGEK